MENCFDFKPGISKVQILWMSNLIFHEMWLKPFRPINTNINCTSVSLDSRGKVFLIVRSLENLLQVSICNYYRTVNFYVYTLNEDKSGWNRVKTLGNLLFFIGKNQTIMLQPKDFPECQNNAIYFTSHYQERLLLSENIWEEYYYDFMGFYCLEDSSMHKSRRKFQNIFPSTWIISGV